VGLHEEGHELFQIFGAVIVFTINYSICSAFVRLVVGFAYSDLQENWVCIIPYFSAFVAGHLGELGGLSTVERFFRLFD